MFGNRLMTAGVTAVLLGALAACGGGHGTAAAHPGTAAAVTASPSPDPVRGIKDTVRHLTRRTTRATRPRLVRRCTTGTRQVRHTARSGSGSHRRTRTWYTTEHYQNCQKVRSGTETYRKELRPERWCVRLDDVNGDRKRDDVWFRVDRTDYDTANAADAHARVQFIPLYPDNGC
ncbi:hypothetical protein [Streptomyces roseochromogenus]|uniref:Lipoprotein n=1 Tax=Streptomyces roseochromogenus subsp. oscitans DS 12.976 TaxID=1352936 RepID=V6KBD3_STRRC|nr:hypothetical protein [Streptomyces roseochromogenus]EST29475.1 hypothetical protein M878_20580 [Streptomyces roseochromogenus subsp. oscitans DS 12.976]